MFRWCVTSTMVGIELCKEAVVEENLKRGIKCSLPQQNCYLNLERVEKGCEKKKCLCRKKQQQLY